MATTTTKEYRVEAQNGSTVIVRREGETVTVQWTCGGQYAFTREGARSALENFELVNLVPDLVWKDKANAGRQAEFYARLIGNEFQADSAIFETATGVPWDKFRSALVKAIGPAKKPTAKRAAAKKKPTAKKRAKK